MGKLTVISVAAIITCCVALACTWGQQTVALVTLAVLVLIVFAAFREIRRTLEKHPELALMDGAEIIAWRKVEMAAKNRSVTLDASVMQDPNPPLQILQASSEEVEEN